MCAGRRRNLASDWRQPLDGRRPRREPASSSVPRPIVYRMNSQSTRPAVRAASTTQVQVSVRMRVRCASTAITSWACWSARFSRISVAPIRSLSRSAMRSCSARSAASSESSSAGSARALARAVSSFLRSVERIFFALPTTSGAAAITSPQGTARMARIQPATVSLRLRCRAPCT